MSCRVIIDTDIGSDIDDAIALALAMKSPEMHIEGVTTVYGNTALRAKLAKKLLLIGGCDDIRVYQGIEKPLLGNRPVWMAGHEGDGVLSDYEDIEYESGHAVDFIIKTIMSSPNEITLIPIGPLTNIAAAMIREPGIAKQAKEIVLMGGVTRLGINGAGLNRHLEHNITSDPEAASVVFRSAANITMVGLDVTSKVRLYKKERDRLSANASPLRSVLTQMLDRWFRYIGEDFTLMHDALAIAVVINPQLVKTRKMSILVDYSNIHPSGQTIGIPMEDENGKPLTSNGGETTEITSESGAVNVCLDVNKEVFMEMLIQRLLTD